MANIKKIFALMVATAMLALGACSETSEPRSNLFIVNESMSEISLIAIHSGNESQAVSNADNSLFKKGATVSFNMGVQKTCLFRVEISDQAGIVVEHGEFTKDFTDGASGQVYLYIRDDGNNGPYITDSKTPPPSSQMNPNIDVENAG